LAEVSALLQGSFQLNLDTQCGSVAAGCLSSFTIPHLAIRRDPHLNSICSVIADGDMTIQWDISIINHLKAIGQEISPTV
jgi:hypothetical protein